MVLFHYALVDDLITQEEFERRVEDKIGECGDLLDEPTAAMLVVGALGRQHVKVRELSGKSSLFCFFAKVIDKTEPKEFTRNDGEKGWVATLLVGDETGTTRVVLWDEKAGAALELHAGRGTGDYREAPGKKYPGDLRACLTKGHQRDYLQCDRRWERVGTVHRAGRSRCAPDRGRYAPGIYAPGRDDRGDDGVRDR